MDKITDVANYIIRRYKELTDETLDEMKLHKLLYFTQRESFAVLGEPAFLENFEGWIYGPVSRDVRNHFINGEIVVPTNPVSEELMYIIGNVILEYGSLASWKLSELTHKETSWLKARAGLAVNENGNQPIDIKDIREDAKKVRPYDHVWDMYYDEFEDADEPASEGADAYDRQDI